MKARQRRPGVLRSTTVVWCFLGVITIVAEGAQAASPPSSAPAPPAQSTPLLNPLPRTTPEALPDVLAQLRARNGEIKALMERGEFGSIYVPALQAKELALALETHRSELGPGVETLLDAALNRMVRCAYLLDVVGDLGNRDQVVAAYAQFEAAARDAEAAFVTKPGEPR
jgi:hypothetical protein